MSRVECIIFGRVQGVFFRDFARECAVTLGITGIAENEKDGSVKIIAEGEKETLETFIKLLKKGHGMATVKDIYLKWGEALRKFSDFSILY